jgi:hypothetical protein
LPQEEINRLAEWAEGGAPEGEAKYLQRRFAAPVWRKAGRPAGREARLGGRLEEAVTVAAVWGKGRGKVWAELPDGAVVPLVWFTGADNGAQWLVYRTPVRLPAGAVLRGGALRVVLAR